MAKQFFSPEDFPNGSQERDILMGALNKPNLDANIPWHEQTLIQLRGAAGSTVKGAPLNTALNRVANYIEEKVTGNPVDCVICSREPTQEEIESWKKS